MSKAPPGDTANGPWARAVGGLEALAVDPAGLGGMWVRARVGPVRATLAAALSALPLPERRLHPAIGDEQLFGGIDLSATLASGQVVQRAGLLADPATLVLPMAERVTPGLAARLAAALDAGTGHCLIALDEGAEPEEALPAALADRLALHVDLEPVRHAEARPIALDPAHLAAARAGLPDVRVPDTLLPDLALLALRLGIESLRAPLLALRMARVQAALAGRAEVSPGDLATAVALVLAPRATQLPESAPDEAEPEPQEPEPEPDQEPEPEPEGDDSPQSLEDLPLQDILLEAAQAALPADLLARLAAQKAARNGASAGGSGDARKGNRRGRPLPSRPGRLDGTARVDLVATLRAAAPWQPLRRAEAADPGRRLHIRPDDIRVRRYEEKSDRLLIFVVDASGSAAMTRLAEAKGAVELLLAEAYARRDHVALVAFRDTAADLLLPPTRSLVQTKRRLAGLPGGGGTPLAAGLKVALEVAHAARARGMTPSIALLTDGRANIALDGSANRAQAGEDAEKMARLVRAQRVAALVIDMGPRPERSLGRLAQTMAAAYIPLPRADAGRLSSAVSAALEA